VISDQAFILHKRVYQDSSELIKLLTYNHGIIDVIAKGSRNRKSKLNGQLQPFILSQVFFSGKSSLKNLIDSSQCEILKSCPYKNHVSMLYCNELLLLLRLEGEVVHEIFTAYKETIKSLQSHQSISLTLRRFEWLLCQKLGYELELPSSVEKSAYIEFDEVNGLQLCNSHAMPCTLADFEKFIQGKTLDSSELKGINWLMRSVINHMLHGKTIQSRQLL
jgi:DNA repair protein RecO (recombination protein O)